MYREPPVGHDPYPYTRAVPVLSRALIETRVTLFGETVFWKVGAAQPRTCPVPHRCYAVLFLYTYEGRGIGRRGSPTYYLHSQCWSVGRGLEFLMRGRFETNSLLSYLCRAWHASYRFFPRGNDNTSSTQDLCIYVLQECT